MDKKFLGISIVVASLILSGTLLYTSLFADTKDRYKVAGSRVFDTLEGKFVTEETPEPTIEINLDYTDEEAEALIDMQKAGEYITPRQRRIINDYYEKQKSTLATNETEETIKGDFSKVKIAGHSYDSSFYYTINCTVKNEDSVEHYAKVQVTYYNKKNEPISTKESLASFIKPGELKGYTIEYTEYSMVKNIAKYDLKLVETSGIFRSK